MKNGRLEKSRRGRHPHSRFLAWLTDPQPFALLVSAPLTFSPMAAGRGWVHCFECFFFAPVLLLRGGEELFAFAKDSVYGLGWAGIEAEPARFHAPGGIEFVWRG
jgi:hypothetical protein